MIAVVCSDSEREITREFFQLFKAPWEFCVKEREYDVVISTLHETPPVEARLVVIYSSKPTQIDISREIAVESAVARHLVGHDGTSIPIYGELACFRVKGRALPVHCRSGSEAVVIELPEPHGKILRVGYDLFDEIAFLLSHGQPVENALIPTLECHVALLRGWIVDGGIPVIEIPPIPWGRSFIVCLTHDIDFVGIRRHKLDRTMWGFIYRALVGSCLRFLRGTSSFDRLVRNWAAVFSLPLVYIGVLDDFWDHFEAYAELEEGLYSTFFLIPFKDRAGDKVQGKDRARRATRYDINDVRARVQDLTLRGFEIGLHGIDAWHSIEKGTQELERITRATGQEQVGVRIHWLCFDRESHAALEQAGFDYDATFGYNETIGYKGGTSQVFKPFGATRLLELPLHIQDTSLFYPRRLGLSDSEAWELCEALLNSAIRFGGVVTVSWHERSLAPERLWGEFYEHLLSELQARGAWFGTAGQVVQWFRERRSVTFEDCRFDGNTLRLRLKQTGDGSVPRWFLRVHRPRCDEFPGSRTQQTHMDVPWSGEPSVEIPLG